MAIALSTLIATRIRLHRENTGFSRRVLSQKTTISERYLAQLEAGKANISLALLQRICLALDVSLTEMVRHEQDEGIKPDIAKFIASLNGKSQERALKLLQEHFSDIPRHQKSGIALVGIRGCGKTTLGKNLATAIGMPFVRLSNKIAQSSGMSIAELTDLGGLEAYRRHELSALKKQIASKNPQILEVSGGVADSPQAYELLIENYNTIYVKASAQEHFDRVTGQHDTRLMQDRENSIKDIKNMLAKRKASFERAHDVLDTTGKTIEDSSHELLRITKRYLEHDLAVLPQPDS